MIMKKLIPVLVISLMLTGCGKKEAAPDDLSLIAEPFSGEGHEQTKEDASSNEEVPAVTLTEEELQEFTELFDTPEYNGFLANSFLTPAEIDWNETIMYGAGLENGNVGEQQIADYLKTVDQKKVYGDLYEIKKSDLAAYIKKHTGMDLMPGDDFYWTYVKDQDAYYREFWEKDHMAYICLSGEKAGDHYTLRFQVSDQSAGINPGNHRGDFADRVIRFTGSGDDLVMESNLIQWENKCDEEQSFEVVLRDGEDPVHFYSYADDPEEIYMVLVKDGKRLESLSSFVESDDFAYLNQLIAVGFFDFNGDGTKDIAVIGNASNGKHILLYQSINGTYSYEWLADLDEKKAAAFGTDFTISGIKAALLGEQGEGTYGSYRELYAQLAKIYHLSSEDYRFALCYVDEDEVPELVIDNCGFGVSLFAYENGRAHCLMDNWGYGVGGNAGYYLAPGKGIFYNGDADYAGAIYYESYLSQKDGGEIATDYWVKYINFNDLGGDGVPSDEEWETEGEYEGSVEYYNNTDKEMTQEEIKAMIDLYDSYPTEPLAADWEYETLLSALQDDAGVKNRITEEQAMAAIKKYCYSIDPELENTEKEGEYPMYWEASTKEDGSIVVLFRSYTAAQIRYYINPVTGDTYTTELVPGILDEEQRTDVHFNAWDYID